MNLHENVWQGLILGKLLFVQIVLRFIFIFKVTSERPVKISRENIDQLPVSNTRPCSFLPITMETSLKRNQKC